VHYIFNNIDINKYKDKINLISHFDKKTDDRITVYLSHGAGEKCEHNPFPLNSDFYLVWNRAEYKHITKMGKKAFLVGSTYNELTAPEKIKKNTLVYVPQHHFTQDINERYFDGNGIPDDIIIGDLLNPYLTVDELESISIDEKISRHITSIVDDTNPDYFDGHNVYNSDREKYEHIYKCKYLYEHAKLCVADILGTFDLVAMNHGIPVKYRTEPKVNMDDWLKMPMKNNSKLINDALSEIHGSNII
jgi:hypothetical protein